jgi:uncharacterized protein DUF1573
MPLSKRLKGFLLPIIFLLEIPYPAEARDNAKLEKQLTQRVDQFYRLSVAGDRAKMLPFVSQDSQDIWLKQHGSKIDSYQIDSVNVSPDGKRADVTVLATFRVLQYPDAPFTQSQKSEWVYEKRKWFLKLKPGPSSLQFFREMGAPSDPAAQRSPLVFDQNPVRLPSPEPGGESVVKVPFQNTNPLVETIQDLKTNCPCLKAEVNISVLRPAEKGTLTITYNESLGNSPDSPLTVEATISPSMYHLRLPVIISKDK